MSIAPENGETLKVAEDVKEATSNFHSMLQMLKRYWPILIITWCVHLGLGLTISITGPTLPYLALNAGSSLSSVSFVYTVRSVIVCVTSLAVGVIVARLSASRSKLLLLLIGSCISMASAITVPHAKSMATLLLGQAMFGISAGIVDTIDNMLVIFLFGPVESRALSHSLHWCVGVGGFAAPLLARPFLVRMGDVGSDASICGGDNGGGVEIANSTTPTTPVNLEPLRWPYLIVAGLHIVWIVGYCVLLLRNFQLKKYSSVVRTNAGVVDFDSRRQLSGVRKAAVVILFVIFFVLHVGQENVFWSLLYSFGICSRLRLSPGEASTLSTVFFVGFLASRTLGIFLARLLSPAKILVGQLLGCLVTTMVLALWGDVNFSLTLIVCCLYGFCIAMVFPTGITWLASKIDVTGFLSSAWFIGAYIGNSTYPAAAGQLVGSAVGAIAVMYLTAATSVAYLLVVAAMFLLAR